jgi:hypothetical protein
MDPGALCVCEFVRDILRGVVDMWFNKINICVANAAVYSDAMGNLQRRERDKHDVDLFGLMDNNEMYEELERYKRGVNCGHRNRREPE